MNEKTKKLVDLLENLISKMQDEDFDNEDKKFFLDEAIKVLTKIWDLNK